MTYKNFPVYIGHGNKVFTSDWGYHKDHMIYAQNVNVNFATVSRPNRRLGEDINKDEQFVYTSDMTCDLDFSFIFYAFPSKFGGDSVYSFLFDSDQYNGTYVLGNGSGTNFFPIKVGGNFYNKCYLENYTITASPVQPVVCSVKFKCYDPPKNVSTKHDDNVPYDNYGEYASSNDIVSSYTCQLNGFNDDIVYSDIVSTMTYTKTYAKTPVYNLGQEKPSSFLSDGINAQMDLESTGLSNLFDGQGTKLNVDVGLNILDINYNRILDTYENGYDILIKSGAKVNTQSYTVVGGDVIASRAQIQEVIL